ncbi:hypothetical protein QBC44DRAFT_109553 [Cladorrhinum sp. PSN332]|nr:hypothetical protein QBC44DRAFT_109553 [Cladorrhinum sp. PSN332]
MSRSVRWGSDSPTGGSHYDHQRSDSGVGSFSDCESRTSNPDGTFIDYEGQSSTYNLQRALEATRSQRDEFSKKIAELEATLRQVRNEFEQTKAHMRAVTENNELLKHEKDTLAEKNKDLVDENTELKEKLDEAVNQLKKANRKSTSPLAVPIVASSASNSDSAEDKKPRRSPSKKRPEKEKERDVEREKEKEKERREKERKKEKQLAKEQREREQVREREQGRERETPADDMDRLRKRFDPRAGEDSDAKSGTIVSSRTRASRRDSYIEPMGNSAPRPQPTPSSSSTRHHSYAANGTYPPSTGYTSIREPSAYSANAPRSVHPQVYVANEFPAYPGEEEGAGFHGHGVVRTPRGR